MILMAFMRTFCFLFSWLILLKTVLAANPKGVRLDNIASSTGLLLVEMDDGKTGYVCSLGMVTNIAQMACHMMGYSPYTGYVIVNEKTDKVNRSIPVILAIQHCNYFIEGETNTYDIKIGCSYLGLGTPSTSSETKACEDPKHLVQVICLGTKGGSGSGGSGSAKSTIDSVTTTPYMPERTEVTCASHVIKQSVQYRLSTGSSRGLLLVKQNGHEAAVCPDGFNYQLASRICKSLCPSSNYSHWYDVSNMGEFSIGYEKIDCTDKSNDLDSCKPVNASAKDCIYSSGVGLQCSEADSFAPKAPNPVLNCHNYSAYVLFLSSVVKADELELYHPHSASTCKFSAYSAEGRTTAIIPFKGCNITQSYNATHLIYTSQLLRKKKEQNGLILEPPYVFTFKCIYKSDYFVAANPIQILQKRSDSKEALEEFVTQIKLYSRFDMNTFNKDYELKSAIAVGSKVFVQVLLTDARAAGLDVRLVLENCWVTGTINRDDVNRLDLVKNRCFLRPATRLRGSNDSEVGIEFNAFQFNKASDLSLYVYCNNRVCNRSDRSEHCKQRSCNEGESLFRVRRSAHPSLMAFNSAVSPPFYVESPKNSATFVTGLEWLAVISNICIFGLMKHCF